MIQYVKKYFILRSYMRRLSRELERRFRKQPFYSIEHVTQAIQRGKLSEEYIAYAHATFCREKDFDTHYRAKGAVVNYIDLRRIIARRYFSSNLRFDAETVINKFRRIDHDRTLFSESGGGDDAGGHD